MHDTYNFRYIGKNGSIDLTINENIILDLLIKNKNYIVTYKKLIDAVYKCQEDKYFKININQYICRLRQKLKGEVEIKNKHNIGYMLV